LTLLCAFKPEPPLTVTSSNNGDLVTIAWDEPVNNGFVIDSYRIFILESDGSTYSEETTECVGNSPSLVSSRECQVQLLSLRSSPYSLLQGDSVWVKIVSINSYGESVESEAGNGAVI
jgi:hypothetical protein